MGDGDEVLYWPIATRTQLLFMQLEYGLREYGWKHLIDEHGFLSEDALAEALGATRDETLGAIIDCWHFGVLTMIDCGENIFFKYRVNYWGFGK